MKQIYLDHNATAPLKAEVLERMLPYLTQHHGNPSSIHWAGRAVSGAIEAAREQLAALINAEPAEIVFTSGGSESNNFALKGAAESRRQTGRHIITTAVEHPAVLETCQSLEKRGWHVTYLPVDDQGQLDLNQLEAQISEQTALISVMWANNETGTLFPIDAIGQIARRHNVLFHTDMVQAIGRVAVDMKQAKLDLASISGHKFGASKGVGALYIRSGTLLEPFIHGGHQERNRRGGTSNVASIVGLGAASLIAQRDFAQNYLHLEYLRTRLEEGLFSTIKGLYLNGAADLKRRLINTLNLSFEGVSGESLLLNLDMKGIAASSGSACGSGTLEPSHVITALGVDPRLAQSSVRFSLGVENTREEIDYVLRELPPLVERLRKINNTV